MTLTRRQFLSLGGGAVLWLSLGRRSTAEAVTIPVLMYHDISHQTTDPLTVSPSLFAAQMEWLYGAGYKACFLQELDRLDAESARRTVIITFDDGFASFITFAFPLFKEYGFKATVNVIGKHMGGFVIGNDPRLSWEECRLLVKSGLVDIGCHTFGLHFWQGDLSRAQALAAFNEALPQDLSAFQEVYRKELGRAVSTLAWPYGIYDRMSTTIAKQAGFRYIVNSENRYFVKGGDLHDIPRISIGNDTDLRLFRELIEGRR
jgi:peptidoglycan/xylan/chitin deacetylase (PgdA/CDA1 family)